MLKPATVQILLAALACAVASAASGQESLAARLAASHYKIAYECYLEGNSDIFVMNADGSNPVNLTKTSKLNEHFPQISPDATRIAFVSDEGEGREAVRSLCVMDIDGGNRKTLVDHAREPFWSPDGKRIGFLPQEFPKFNVIDYYTKGLNFYELATGRIEPHVNSGKLHHLYNPGMSVDGRWIVSTVHAGMGFGHAILLIEAAGDRIVNLNIPGCRPCFSPDAKQVAWGADDHEIAAAPINWDAAKPTAGARRVRVKDAKNKIYHVDWSPDGRFLCVSRGPDGEGDLSKPGTFQAACEIMGVYAAGWDLCVVDAEQGGVIDLNDPGEKRFTMVTHNGASNKEPAWFRAR